MRAHTITTKPRVEAGARTKRTILALSLVVVLLGATASAASATTTLSTTSTPPPPLTLSVSAKARVEKGYGRLLIFPATTSHASSLVVTGRKIQKTTYDLEPGVREWIHAEFKHLPRRDKVKVKIKATATDEFGQTATDHVKYVLRRYCGGKPGDPKYGTKAACNGWR